MPAATGGATAVSSSAISGGAGVGAGADVAAAPAAATVVTGSVELVADCNLLSPAGLRRVTCSFVSGPQRYDIAQRVASRRGVEDFAETRRN